MSAPRWITPAGSIGTYPALIPLDYQLVAITDDDPDIVITYQLISGSLPIGITLRIDGIIIGTPGIVSGDTTAEFVVRATDALGGIKDRTFEMTISGQAIPKFTTPAGPLFQTLDSQWIEFPILYSNPIPENPVNIRLFQGSLPPGLEINEYGLIRGYPEPPKTVVNYPELITYVTATDSTNNYVTVIGTNGISVDRPIYFTSPTVGNLQPYPQIYYVKSIVNATQITLTNIPGGEVLQLTSGTGFMTATLPPISIGEAAVRQYSFTLELSSPLGNDTKAYSITVLNHYLPTNEGGPNPANPPGLPSRIPTIYNTRPPTYNIEGTPDFGYYVLPPLSEVSVPGMTYETTQEAYIGQFLSDNYFAFKIIGHDFDTDDLIYQFTGSVLVESGGWLTGDVNTGWIYGIPSIPIEEIEQYSFTVQAKKKNNPQYISPVFNFSFNIANGITGKITWLTSDDLGVIDNATVSDFKIQASSDVPLEYELVTPADSLPPNLIFNSNGEISGVVSYQPTDNFKEKNETTTYTFTVRAYSPTIPLVTSTKEFTLTVKQTYDIPTDNLYIKCTPSLADRDIISTLLNDPVLIPNDYLYRPDDINYGKANSIVYGHAYGIYSSDMQEYIEATKKNHYWRNIVLGELKTAIARDEDNNILYEVLYSTVIDNLQKYDPNYNYDYRYSESVSEEIFWPRFIDLNLGPWYASSTDIYASYIFNQEAQIITNFRMFDLLTQTGLPILLNGGIPTFNTSLTPGYARVLYPNSLENMRKRVEQELGVDYNFKLLPLWMTSQQEDGNTLGFTPAWVICYTKIPEPQPVIALATWSYDNAISLQSTYGIVASGEIIFSNDVFGGIKPNKTYYVVEVDHPNFTIKISETPGGSPIVLNDGSGYLPGVYDVVSYAQVIKNNIENDWPYRLNDINFQIDRFTVGKTLTYNYDTKLQTKSWTRFPSGTPVPDPTDSQDFYVLFPRKTILPTKTQYKL